MFRIPRIQIFTVTHTDIERAAEAVYERAMVEPVQKRVGHGATSRYARRLIIARLTNALRESLKEQSGVVVLPNFHGLLFDERDPETPQTATEVLGSWWHMRDIDEMLDTFGRAITTPGTCLRLSLEMEVEQLYRQM